MIVIFLYHNMTYDKLKEAKYVCCETNLNFEHTNNLKQQLRKDENVLENTIGNEKIIYIGFIG